MGEALVRLWKINNSLHQVYGGRNIYRQAGPESGSACCYSLLWLMMITVAGLMVFWLRRRCWL